MLTKFAYAYVWTLAALVSMLLILLIILHCVEIWTNAFEFNGHLFFLWFFICAPALSLAEDRNIWTREVRDSPVWLRYPLAFLFVYVFLVFAICILFGGTPTPIRNAFLAMTAFMLMMSTGCLCVLYSTLKTAKTSSSDLIKRARRSLITSAAFVAFFLVAFFVFPRPLHHG